MLTISKSCADFLRHNISTVNRLQSSHAHELVAAYFGYHSRAALLSERRHGLHKLASADVLVPDISLMDERRKILLGLPSDLPTSREVAEMIGEHLGKTGFFPGKIWLYDSLENYLMEVYFQGSLGFFQNELSSEMAETNAYFDEVYFDSANLDNGIDEVAVILYGQLNGDTDPERPFSGDQIDIVISVDLARIAGKVAFAEPRISVKGSVNYDW